MLCSCVGLLEQLRLLCLLTAVYPRHVVLLRCTRAMLFFCGVPAPCFAVLLHMSVSSWPPYTCTFSFRLKAVEILFFLQHSFALHLGAMGSNSADAVATEAVYQPDMPLTARATGPLPDTAESLSYPGKSYYVMPDGRRLWTLPPRVPVPTSVPNPMDEAAQAGLAPMESCIICLDMITANTAVVQMSCSKGHLFHYACVHQHPKLLEKCTACQVRCCVRRWSSHASLMEWEGESAHREATAQARIASRRELCDANRVAHLAVKRRRME